MGREDRKKAQGSKLRERPKYSLNLGTENWLSYLQLVIVPLGPTSKGSLPMPWEEGWTRHPPPTPTWGCIL